MVKIVNGIVYQDDDPILKQIESSRSSSQNNRQTTSTNQSERPQSSSSSADDSDGIPPRESATQAFQLGTPNWFGLQPMKVFGLEIPSRVYIPGILIWMFFGTRTFLIAVALYFFITRYKSSRDSQDGPSGALRDVFFSQSNRRQQQPVSQPETRVVAPAVGPHPSTRRSIHSLRDG